MFHRIFNHLRSQSFFIFGARGTGKSTYLEMQFDEPKYTINLLEEGPFTRYATNTDLLRTDLKSAGIKNEWVVIDEIQKVPKILDAVHHLIEREKYKFILTGSSARKLKRQSADLLAGRAFSYNLYPLTFLELGDTFHLENVLKWGSLPKVFSLDATNKAEYLRSYGQTYLKEEILQEQIVRTGVTFQNFLAVAAQENGKLINFSKIAKDIGADVKTVQNYFQILEDTLVGFFLPAYHRSVRKSVGQAPKFYLFDLGIKRALEGALQQDLKSSTSLYGDSFEHFFITEFIRLNNYSRSDYLTYQYHTNTGGEVDLVATRGKEILAIEIKSYTQIREEDALKFSKAAGDIKATKKVLVSQDQVSTTIKDVSCTNWQAFLKTLI